MQLTEHANRARIDVAMTVRDGEAHLEEQLASISRQTRPPDRLVVVDDGSRDRSLEILEEFARSAPFPVLVVRGAETVLGPVGAFECALSHCDADLIAICDQDDVWWPDRVGHVEARFSLPDPPAAVFCDGAVIDAVGRTVEGSIWDAFDTLRSTCVSRTGFFVHSLARPSVPGCTLTFTGDMRKLALPFPDPLRSLGVDMRADGWILSLCAAAGRVCGLEERLMSYRLHAAQQIGLAGRGQGAARRRASRIVRGEPLVEDELDRRAAATRLVQERLRSRLATEQAEDCAAALEELLSHLDRRRTLPPGIPRRIGVVASELARGRYGRFSSGVKSAAADLVRGLPLA